MKLVGNTTDPRSPKRISFCDSIVEEAGQIALRLVGDDGLWNVEERGTQGQWDRDGQLFIDSNSWVLQSYGRVP